jgi:hypothetical protein
MSATITAYLASSAQPELLPAQLQACQNHHDPYQPLQAYCNCCYWQLLLTAS